MITSALFAFVHFVAAFGIFAMVFVTWQTMSLTPTHAEARRIQLCDRWYGILAAVVLAVGFLRAFYFEKGFAFYKVNPFFHAKLGLFILVGLLSIYPTIRFIKWRAQTNNGRAPAVSDQEYRWIMGMLRAELVLLLGVALCASLMSRGLGVR